MTSLRALLPHPHRPLPADVFADAMRLHDDQAMLRRQAEARRVQTENDPARRCTAGRVLSETEPRDA